MVRENEKLVYIILAIHFEFLIRIVFLFIQTISLDIFFIPNLINLL